MISQGWLTVWYESKMFIERSVAISPDALHVFAGVLVAGIAAALLRKPLSSPLPLLVTLIAVLINEVGDLLVEIWPSLGMQLGEGMRDVLLTMSVPGLIFLAVRHLPQLFSFQKVLTGREVRRSD